MFYEQPHAAHYNKVGNSWWNDFVDAEINQVMFSSNSPYGTGNAGAISDIFALGESWAYHMGHFMSDRKYGSLSSPTGNLQFIFNNNNPIIGLSSHLNALEEFDPNLADPDSWIPIGIYLDLIDNRNEFNSPITDDVTGITNQQLFNALDVDVKSMPQYRERLIGENPNNQTFQIRALFTQYNIL